MNSLLVPLVTVLAMHAVETPDANVSAWFAPSTFKVMRDAKPDRASATWSLAAARNEVESCQLVLLSDRPIQGVTVTASRAEAVGGNGSLQPTLFKVEYVSVLRERVPYPDPLPPLAAPFSLQAGQVAARVDFGSRAERRGAGHVPRHRHGRSGSVDEGVSLEHQGFGISPCPTLRHARRLSASVTTISRNGMA